MIIKTVAALFASAAMAALPVMGADRADDVAKRTDVIKQLDSRCQTLDTLRQAKVCLESAYTYAIAMAHYTVWDQVESNKNAVDPNKLTDEQVRYFKTPGLYRNECMPVVPGYRSGQAPEEYLRHAAWCLALATDTAEASGINYDKENAAHLLSMIRRLRRYDAPAAP